MLHNLVPRAHVSLGQRHDTCLDADQKTRGLWERDCMLHDYVAVAVVVRTRPRATMRKLTHWLPFLSCMSMGLGGPSG